MKNLNIKPVLHVKGDKNRYCGPSAISAITGMNTGEAARMIRHVGGRKSVKGSFDWEVREVLERCGIRSVRENFGLKLGRSKGPTLAAWLRHTVKERTAKRVFLIVAGWHYQLVQGRRIVCGILGEPKSIRDKKVKRRARVAEVFELHSMGKICKPPEAIKPKRPVNSDYSTAQRMAKAMNIDIDIDKLSNGESQKWIGGYDDVDENGEDIDFTEIGVIEYHCCYDWWEVCDTLNSIAEYRKEHGYNRAVTIPA
jgi:hypothetical protein